MTLTGRLELEFPLRSLVLSQQDAHTLGQECGILRASSGTLEKGWTNKEGDDGFGEEPFLPVGADKRLCSKAELQYLALPERLALGVYAAASATDIRLLYPDIAQLRDISKKLDSPVAKTPDRTAIREFTARADRVLRAFRVGILPAVLGEDVLLSFIYLVRPDLKGTGAATGAVSYASSAIGAVFLEPLRLDVAAPEMSQNAYLPPTAEKGTPPTYYLTLESVAFRAAIPFIDLIFQGTQSSRHYSMKDVVKALEEAQGRTP